jgi:hypothetical protein
MSFAHEAIAALPVLTAADKALIRAMCTRRFAYCLSASELSTDLVVVDPASGAVPLYLIQNSTMFAYDSTDSTTAHDGVTCLVSSDGKRFKSGTIAPPYSVLTKGTTAQPASPAVGDRYLIPTAATGVDWAGKDNKIGIYTAAGWRFAISPVGRFLYVEDETAFYHRNTAGTWTAGVGSIALGAGSVPITAIIGAKASVIIKVENATTNTPPGSPVAPVAYIIGSAPTGAWAGNAGKLAICLVNGAFTIITPDVGDEVFDKALGINVKWGAASAWASASGRVLGSQFARTDSNASPSGSGSGLYSYSPAGAPTTVTSNTLLTSYATYAAKAAGNYLEFEGSFNFTFGATGPFTIGLFRDLETTAVAWQIFWSDSIRDENYPFRFLLTAVDTTARIYKIRYCQQTTVMTVATFGHLVNSIKEYTP